MHILGGVWLCCVPKSGFIDFLETLGGLIFWFFKILVFDHGAPWVHKFSSGVYFCILAWRLQCSGKNQLDFRGPSVAYFQVLLGQKRLKRAQKRCLFMPFLSFPICYYFPIFVNPGWMLYREHVGTK